MRDGLPVKVMELHLGDVQVASMSLNKDRDATLVLVQDHTVPKKDSMIREVLEGTFILLGLLVY